VKVLVKLFQKVPGGTAKTLRGTLTESFDKTFSKVFRAPATKRRSRVATREILLRRFLLLTFLLRQWCQKKSG